MAASPFEDHLTWQKVGEMNGKSADAEPPTQPPLECPECGSSRIWKNGFRYAHSETGGEIAIQRFICRDCGRRFSEDTALGSRVGSNPIRQKDTPPCKPYLQLNRHVFNLSREPSTCQVCVSDGETKNLSHQRTRQKRAAGATKLSKEQITGKLVEYSWYLKKQGYANGRDGEEGTIQKRTRMIKRLFNLGANLFDPESVKEVIATQENWSEGYKATARYAYESFLKMEGMTWDPPRYKPHPKVPFVPLESEIDRLISGCGRKISVFLHGLKETGADPGELWRVEWTDINEKTRTIDIRHPVKGHNPRILPISREYIPRLQLLPKKAERIFPMTMSSLRANFWLQRKQKARDFNNPRLLKLTFTSIRHWKATVEYHKTRDILHVKRLLGHKKLTSTMIYIDIERALFGAHQDDEFITRAARSVKGARALIEAGFAKADEIDGVHIYCKRK